MTVLLLTRKGVRNVNIKPGASQSDVTELEALNAALNDARIEAIELLTELEKTSRLNKPRAIGGLQRALAGYERLVATLTKAATSGCLRHYYRTLKEAAQVEFAEVKGLLESVLIADNDKFNLHYTRYVRQLDKTL